MPTSSELFFSENFTLTPIEIANAAVILARNPVDPNNVAVNVIDGTPQIPGIDYVVVGRTIGWAGYALESLLEAGDILRVEYLSDNSVNVFSTEPARNGAYVKSLINVDSLLSFTIEDPDFYSLSQISRVDVTYVHEDNREKKTLVHMGSDLHAFVEWSSMARPGTWKKMQVRLRDTDGAIKILNREQLGSYQDLILS